MRYTIPKKEQRRLLENELEQFRLPHESTWTDIADLALPFRIRLQMSDYGRGDRRNTRIYNSTATRALKTFQSGLMTAAVDPTSTWVNMTTGDPDRAEYGPHKEWLDIMTDLLLRDVADSNAYQTLPKGFGNEAAFGFFALGIEERFNITGPSIHTRLYPTGSCWFGMDDYGRVNTFMRKYRSTVRQLYMRFGEQVANGAGDFSREVEDLIDKGDWEQWIDCVQLIEPNDDFDPRNPMAKHKAYSSCWYEAGNSSKGAYDGKAVDGEAYLSEGGFDMFPVMAGMWETTESEVYPTEYPGSESLPDNKSLQIGEKRKAQGIEKLINPHWLAPAAMKGLLDKGMLPGDTSYVDERNEGKSVRPAHLMDPAFISPMQEHLNEVKQRILESFHYPTFATFDSLPDKQRTATEILERKSEKLLKLVDMYTNLQIGVLRPMMDYLFNIRIQRGDYPTPPPDLQGHKLDYRFSGVLAQAQKMNRIQPIEKIMGIVANWAAQTKNLDVLDKFNVDQAVDEIATNLGVPATVINSDEVVAAIRKERAKQQQAAQMAQSVPAMAGAAKDLSQASLDGNNALAALAGARG